MSAPVRVDVLLIGAGPVGLFGAYYAGFRGLRMAVMDSLPQVGGQVSALYPQKDIHDIAGFPSVTGQELVDRLFRQAAPFDPVYLLGQEAERLERVGDRIVVTSAQGVTVEASAVVITAGAGSASPRPLPCGEQFLGRGLHYFVPDMDVFTGRDVVVVGGGDSAVDWALAATEKASNVRLVHRGQSFRAHGHSVSRLQASRCELTLGAQISALRGDDRLRSVEISTGEVVPADVVVAALGFKLQLGPIASWGLELRGRSVLVDAAMATSVPGVYAAGDIATHDRKVKLIAVGFGEVATAVNNAAAVLQPEVGLAPGHSSDSAPAVLAASEAYQRRKSWRS